MCPIERTKDASVINVSVLLSVTTIKCATPLFLTTTTTTAIALIVSTRVNPDTHSLVSIKSSCRDQQYKVTSYSIRVPISNFLDKVT